MEEEEGEKKRVEDATKLSLARLSTDFLGKKRFEWSLDFFRPFFFSIFFYVFWVLQGNLW